VLERWYNYIERTLKKEKPMIYPSALLIICAIGTLIFVPQAFSRDSSENFNPDLQRVLEENPTSRFILTNEPSPASITDNKIVLFGGMETAMIAYEAYRNDSGLIVVRDCNFICSSDDLSCSKQRGILFDRITTENRQIFHKTVKGCTIAVYQPEREKQSEK